MARVQTLVRASDMARKAAGVLDVAGCGVTPAKRLMLQQEAEAALYEAIDLIWRAKEPVRDRFFRVAAEIAARPANDTDFSPETTPPPAAPCLQRSAA